MGGKGVNRTIAVQVETVGVAAAQPSSPGPGSVS
jgi:hypothetical protein